MTIKPAAFNHLDRRNPAVCIDDERRVLTVCAAMIAYCAAGNANRLVSGQ